MEMHEELKQRTGEVEAVIEQYLPEETGHQKTIFEAMNYSMRAGGKRLRPMLMQETCRLFGGEGREIEPFMAAIEMIHTSSLIHDDLPCMDNDELRRGLPTTWKKFGYDMAVLAGDALMMYAIETAAKAYAVCAGQKAELTGQKAEPVGQKPETTGQSELMTRISRSISLLAVKTGIYGMIGGQVVDVELTDKPVPKDKLDFIYRLKTGALLEASMMIGAILGGADDEQIQTVEKMAAAVGMAFQIQDDILDVTSTAQMLGKPVLSDEKNNKTTYVTLMGIDRAKADVAEISNHAIELLHELPGENPFLENLIRMLITREK